MCEGLGRIDTTRHWKGSINAQREDPCTFRANDPPKCSTSKRRTAPQYLSAALNGSGLVLLNGELIAGLKASTYCCMLRFEVLTRVGRPVRDVSSFHQASARNMT